MSVKGITATETPHIHIKSLDDSKWHIKNV